MYTVNVTSVNLLSVTTITPCDSVTPTGQINVRD